MKSMKKYLKYYLCFIAAILFLMAVPVSAEPLDYQKIYLSYDNVNYYDGIKVKVGNYYFWNMYNSDTRIHELYSSKSAKAKKGTLVARIKADGSCNILTNGSKVYYINDNSRTKHTLYEVSVNGKNKKKITVISGPGVYLIHYYNNKIYYEKIYSINSSRTDYCSLSLKTKKTKTLIKDYKDATGAYTAGDYIFIVDYKEDKDKSMTIRIFDCKKNKVIKKHTIKNCGGFNAFGTYIVEYEAGVIKDYFYVAYQDHENDELVIYRCPKNGSGSMKLFKKIASVEVKAIDKYIYYWDYSNYYRLNPSSKKTQKISSSTYDKAVEKYYY